METKEQILATILISKTRELIDMLLTGRDYAADDVEVDAMVNEIDTILSHLGSEKQVEYLSASNIASARYKRAMKWKSKEDSWF